MLERLLYMKYDDKSIAIKNILVSFFSPYYRESNPYVSITKY